MDPSLKRHGVEVGPDPLVLVVIGGELLPALRTRPEGSVGIHQIDIDLLLSHMEFNSFDRPTRLQPGQTAAEICVLHTIHRHAGTAPTPSGYPPSGAATKDG